MLYVIIFDSDIHINTVTLCI